MSPMDPMYVKPLGGGSITRVPGGGTNPGGAEVRVGRMVPRSTREGNVGREEAVGFEEEGELPLGLG